MIMPDIPDIPELPLFDNETLDRFLKNAQNQPLPTSRPEEVDMQLLVYEKITASYLDLHFGGFPAKGSHIFLDAPAELSDEMIKIVLVDAPSLHIDHSEGVRKVFVLLSNKNGSNYIAMLNRRLQLAKDWWNE